MSLECAMAAFASFEFSFSAGRPLAARSRLLRHRIAALICGRFLAVGTRFSLAHVVAPAFLAGARFALTLAALAGASAGTVSATQISAARATRRRERTGAISRTPSAPPCRHFTRAPKPGHLFGKGWREPCHTRDAAGRGAAW